MYSASIDIILSLNRPSNLKIPVKVTQPWTLHDCNQHTSPYSPEDKASVNYWLFTKAKGGNESTQYNHRALEINSTEHYAQLGLSLLCCLVILDPFVLNQYNTKKPLPGKMYYHQGNEKYTCVTLASKSKADKALFIYLFILLLLACYYLFPNRIIPTG